MKENYLIEDIIEKYGKVEFKKTNFHGNNSSKFLSDLLKGIDCDKCFFRTNDGLPLNSTQVEKKYEQFIENREQLACLDRDNITIRSKDKRLRISTEEYLSYSYNEVMTMHHSTEEGLYYFRLQAVCDANREVKRYEFDLLHYPLQKGESQMNVGVEQPICFVDPEYTVAHYKPIEIVEEDIPKLTNKLFREGLPVLCEKIRNGEKFEITKEDRKYYGDLAEEVIEVNENVQESHEPLIKEDNESIVENDVQVNKEFNENLNVNQVIDVLLYLRDKGIELSDEQKNLIYLYGEVNSTDNKQPSDSFEEENSKTK